MQRRLADLPLERGAERALRRVAQLGRQRIDLKGIDLSGDNVIVTGGHTGLGLETTRALSKAGASVTVGSRNPDRAAPALAGIERVEVDRLDLLDPTSIDAFAARYLGSGRPLHILINNAGIMAGPLFRRSSTPTAR